MAGAGAGAGAAADGQEKLIAMAQHIVNSLCASTDSYEEMLRTLSGFDRRLAAMTGSFPSTAATGKDEASDAAASLNEAEKLIARWDVSNPNSIWASSSDVAGEYLSAVDKVVLLARGGGGSGNVGLVGRAKIVAQIAMARLKDEFHHLVSRHSRSLDAHILQDSFKSLSLSSHSDSGDSITTESEPSVRAANPAEIDLSSNLIPSEIMPVLREIAERMIWAGYQQQLRMAYTSARRKILNDSVSVLRVDKLSVEEAQRIDGKTLHDLMKRWAQSLKTLVRVLLSGERKLCDEIFAPYDELREECFTEATKVHLMRLLNFWDAIDIEKWSSDKVVPILGIYEALAGVLPSVEAMFSGDSKEFICGKIRGDLRRLGDAARGMLARFGNAMQKETTNPLQGGSVHPLTQYVMNYIRKLEDFGSTLDAILVDGGGGDESLAPSGRHISLLISFLESKLEEKSRLYEDDGMRYIFLINNMFHVVQTVRDSKLKTLLGDDWVRNRRGQVRRYATSYLRACWTRALVFLKNDGLGGSGSSRGAPRSALKEKFKNFNLAFEEIYRTQTTWSVPDPQLREELRLSISEMVIPAYRSFVGRYRGQLDGERHLAKYIKYTPEDLETYLSDLFEGLQWQSGRLKRRP